MRSISDTIARLSKMRPTKVPPVRANEKLTDFDVSGPNPGGLEAKIHAPIGLLRQSALVVVLHGCTQSAASYDHGSGWSHLAEDYGFVVLYPQQTRANNPNTCFNWFVPGDIQRDQGEAYSIRQIIRSAVERYDIDPRRIFITGLSAGGAMANVMLANYPELFAGGAIIAGLPFGTAKTVPEAFDRMRGHGLPDTEGLQSLLGMASRYGGPWPTISIWQGASDTTVMPANALAIVEQWRGVHGVNKTASIVETADGYRRQGWTTSDGREAIEYFEILGMGHGTPLDVSSAYGKSAAYMLDVGISSTLHIARGWGLVASFERRAVAIEAEIDMASTLGTADAAQHATPASGVQKTIEDALRAAGLLK